MSSTFGNFLWFPFSTYNFLLTPLTVPTGPNLTPKRTQIFEKRTRSGPKANPGSAFGVRFGVRLGPVGTVYRQSNCTHKLMHFGCQLMYIKLNNPIILGKTPLNHSISQSNVYNCSAKEKNAFLKNCRGLWTNDVPKTKYEINTQKYSTAGIFSH